MLYTMLDRKQFTEHIIRPALEAIDLYSEAAAELLLGTAIQESRLTYLKQLGGGPALGLFQMEPATFADIHANFLAYRAELSDKLLRICDIRKPEFMIHNLHYAAAMCRIHYYRDSQALPEVGDLPAQAAYWKRVYNTPLGAGTEQEYIDNWNKSL